MLALLPGVVESKRYGKCYVPDNALPAVVPYTVPSRALPSNLPLRQYQNEGVTFLDEAVRGALLADDVGLGKQQPVDVKVSTPEGWREIGGLTVGCTIHRSDGQVGRVTGVYPQGIKPSYRVRFSDGSGVEAGPEHLWTVAYRIAANRPYRWAKLTLTTEQLRTRPRLARIGSNGQKYSLDLVRTRLFLPILNAPLTYPEHQLPIPPYLVGQLIANGSLAHGTPSLASALCDWPELLANFEKTGYAPSSYRVYGTVVQATFSGLLPALRMLGMTTLSGKKRVPRCYMEAAQQARVDLLHGLMDGDGSVSKTRNRLTYHTTSIGLAQDVQELVEGLGGTTGRYTQDRTAEGKSIDYTVRVRVPKTVAPFTVSRKASRYQPGCHALPVRTITGVDYVRDVESVCIAVDAPDQLYVTERCILTHNTVTTATYLWEHSELRPFLVIGPLITTGSWVGPDADPEKHCGLRIRRLSSTTPDPDQLDDALDGYFVNYDVLPAWYPWIDQMIKPRVVVLDEAENIRNPRTQAAKVARKICQADHVVKRIALTATPVVNGIWDLWMILECIQPGMWGHYVAYNESYATSFCQRYASAQRDEYGWRMGAEANVEELRYRAQRVILRRSRFDVRKELPPFVRARTVVPRDDLEAKAYDAYKEAERLVADTVALQGLTLQGAELQRTTAMAQHLSWAKRQVAAKRAFELALASETRKIVVFCWYQKTAAFIAKALVRRGVAVFGPVTGAMNVDKRLALAAQFRDYQDDAQRSSAAYVATLGAAGVGLNPLAAAATALFVDLYWVPRVLLQAEGRLHREGQKASSVLFEYLVVERSIDTIMYEHLVKKAKTLVATTQDTEGTSLCETLGGKSTDENLKSFLAQIAELSAEDLELG